MMNFFEIDNVKAHIQYDPEIELFRGEFIGLNGGADFYANNIADLKKEGKISLNTFLDVCKENNIEPFKQFSGKFVIRVSPEIHEKITLASLSNEQSINKWATDVLQKAVN